MDTNTDPRHGLQTFADWLAHEMPPGTVIGDPKWWAPRIARAYESALAHARPEAVDDDSRRLDALEADIAKHGPLTLHNGEGARGVCRGLGLSNTGRTLRQALDDLTPERAP